MKINNIGIVGNGFVGNALYENIKLKYSTKVYDVQEQKCLNSLEIVFVCLPTPMRSADGAECNLTIINDFFISIPKNSKALFVIKSTVPIGTTKSLKLMRSDLKVVHNPEFLTAINAIEDFKNSYRNVIGGSQQDSELLVELLEDLFPKATNYVVSSDESEMIKYYANTFLATKVSFFNLVYDMCEKIGANYDNVVQGVCSDERIGFSHTNTPGPDGDRGFGGTCFPKDINALITTYKNLSLDSSILEEVWKYNKKIRKNWDWAKSKSATME
jgi:UDPglucose 6-dehydrogenase